jgi:predicted nucleotidyltransferase
VKSSPAVIPGRREAADLLGSLAHGGFNRRYSDIDMALVTENGIDQATLEAVKTEAAALSPELATKLSIFWSDRRFTIGRFPPLDRVDYLDHAVALIERERADPIRPTLCELGRKRRALRWSRRPRRP